MHHATLSRPYALMGRLIPVIIVLLLGIIYIATKPQTSITVLQTKSIPILAPHEHNINKDSLTDTGHGIEVVSPVYTPEKDLWVTSIEYENIHAASSTLHHAILTSTKVPLVWCTNDPDTRNFIILTEDQMDDPNVEFPTGYALRIPAGTPLILYAMFHNAEPPIGRGDTYSDVSGKITLHTTEPTFLHPLKALKFYSPRVADNPCEPKDIGYFFSIPANVKDYRVTKSKDLLRPQEITFNSPTTVKFWGAHLHGWEGGKALVVKKNGEELYTFETKQSPTDRFEYLTPQGPTNMRFMPGDVLSLEAVYDNLSPEPIVGAMGILYMFASDE